ncbi:hypothetical protein FRC06_008990, partial [Ceratobasidium sp. 370]
EQAEAAREKDEKWQRDLEIQEKKANERARALEEQVESLKQGHGTQQAEWQKMFMETQEKYLSGMAEMEKAHGERMERLIHAMENQDRGICVVAYRAPGPVSVTIHITSVPHSHQTSLIETLHSLYTSSPLFPRWVDVHLVIDTHDRQFNLWRNVARLYARTAWVMMLDVDFVVCTDVRARFKQALSIGEAEGDEGNVGALAGSGRAAFVVPAFEYVVQEEGKDWRVFPKDKKGLMDLVKAGKIEMFHRSWAPGHNSTSYDQYYAAQPGEVYRVDAYQKSYEPYVIMQRDGPPWCDERFVGYGGNKAACLFSIYISGIDFYVLPDDFLIHQSHAYAEETRKNERKYNRQVYDDFRKEICLEQIAQSMRSNTLYTDAKSNLREECMKPPGVSEVVLQSLKEYQAEGRGFENN